MTRRITLEVVRVRRSEALSAQPASALIDSSVLSYVLFNALAINLCFSVSFGLDLERSNRERHQPLHTHATSCLHY